MMYSFFKSNIGHLVVLLVLLSSCSRNNAIEVYQSLKENKIEKANRIITKLTKSEKGLSELKRTPIVSHLINLELGRIEGDTLKILKAAKAGFVEFDFLSEEAKSDLANRGINPELFMQWILAYDPPEKQVEVILAKRQERELMLEGLLADLISIAAGGDEGLNSENEIEKSSSSKEKPAIPKSNAYLPSNMTFDLNSSGVYGEHLEIFFEYGQDVTTNPSLSNRSETETKAENSNISEPSKTALPNIPGFSIGKYSSVSADNALNLFSKAIDDFVKQDPQSFDNIVGIITGYADGIPIGGKGLDYTGEAGKIDAYPYKSLNSNSIKESPEFVINGKIKNNEELAFVRAYYSAKQLIKSDFISEDKLQLNTFVSDSKGAEFRKVVIELKIENAYASGLEDLPEEVKSKLAEETKLKLNQEKQNLNKN